MKVDEPAVHPVIDAVAQGPVPSHMNGGSAPLQITRKLPAGVPIITCWNCPLVNVAVAVLVAVLVAVTSKILPPDDAANSFALDASGGVYAISVSTRVPTPVECVS